jgi:hypothetical protein
MSSEPVPKAYTADDAKLHHFGFVVSSIGKSEDSFARSLAATWDQNIIFDPIQNVKVAFFRGSNLADPLIIGGTGRT